MYGTLNGVWNLSRSSPDIPAKQREKRGSTVFWATPASALAFSANCHHDGVQTVLWHTASLRCLKAISPRDPALPGHLQLLQSGCVNIYYNPQEMNLLPLWYHFWNFSGVWFCGTHLESLKLPNTEMEKERGAAFHREQWLNRGYGVSSVVFGYGLLRDTHITKKLILKVNFSVFRSKNTLQGSSNKSDLRHLLPSS